MTYQLREEPANHIPITLALPYCRAQYCRVSLLYPMAIVQVTAAYSALVPCSFLGNQILFGYQPSGKVTVSLAQTQILISLKSLGNPIPFTSQFGTRYVTYIWLIEKKDAGAFGGGLLRKLSLLLQREAQREAASSSLGHFPTLMGCQEEHKHLATTKRQSLGLKPHVEPASLWNSCYKGQDVSLLQKPREWAACYLQPKASRLQELEQIEISGLQMRRWRHREVNEVK